MSNRVLTTLARILDEAERTNIVYRGKMYRLDADDLPDRAAAAFVTRELKDLSAPADEADEADE